MNLISIFKEFPSEVKCVKFLEKKRWKDGIKCPYCESDNKNKLVAENRHHCNECRKSFSVTVDTIFHHIQLELQKWFFIYCTYH
jgi:transposase-like protein